MDSLLLTTKQLEHIGLAVLSFIGYKQTNKILWKTMPGRLKQVPQDSTE